MLFDIMCVNFRLASKGSPLLLRNTMVTLRKRVRDKAVSAKSGNSDLLLKRK